jgi:hypothetical protein
MGIAAIAVKLLAVAALMGAGGAGAALYVLDAQGITPRALGPYVQVRSHKHNRAIEDFGSAANAWLTRLDRGEVAPRAPAPWRIGAHAAAGAPAPTVASVDQLKAALAAANPGDTIVLAPGTYHIGGRGLKINRAGREGAPITLRGGEGVRIESSAVAAFTVEGAWWRFEHLNITGVCRKDADCEHAFHVVGDASHFSASHNTISDFNAHFKINGRRERFPDHGLIEANTLTNSAARKTRKPVTPIDLVAASNWIIRSNLISDFVKDGGDRVSYGAFAKGAGGDTLFERNIVICEWKLQRAPGQRVGLSLGGGGTGGAFCRDGKCAVEQERGTLRDNLIASCSDVGVYLNNAAASRILHNTLVDTAGVAVRFAGSSAQVEGNLIDGAIKSRDGGEVRAFENLDTSVAAQYFGRHPQRALFRSAQALDFRWAEDAPRRSNGAAGAVDLCGAKRPAAPRYGAFEDFSACLLP